MSHIKHEQWVAYVVDDVDEAMRRAYEQHLSVCDECLDLYMQAIESNADMLPKLADDITDKVMENVKKRTKSKQNEQKTQPIYQKSFFHYVIAAAMTLILMSSGIFGQLTQVASNIEQKAENPNPSLTEELLDKTLSFIQVMERNKEAK